MEAETTLETWHAMNVSSFSLFTYASAKIRIERCLYREVDEIWQYRTGGNLTTFDKDHGTAEEGRLRRFLQPSIRLRYNYHVQLVATKRDWMRVPNLHWRSL